MAAPFCAPAASHEIRSEPVNASTKTTIPVILTALLLGSLRTFYRPVPRASHATAGRRDSLIDPGRCGVVLADGDPYAHVHSSVCGGCGRGECGDVYAGPAAPSASQRDSPA